MTVHDCNSEDAYTYQTVSTPSLSPSTHVISPGAEESQLKNSPQSNTPPITMSAEQRINKSKKGDCSFNRQNSQESASNMKLSCDPVRDINCSVVPIIEPHTSEGKEVKADL